MRFAQVAAPYDPQIGRTESHARHLGPRDAMRFTDWRAALLAVGRVQAGSVRLPSRADVVGDTRKLYSRGMRPGHLADRTRSA